MSKDEEETVYLFLKKEWQRCTNNCKIWCRWNGLKNVRLMVPEPLTLYRPLWDPLSRPVPSPALATGYPRYHEASNVFFKLVISWSRDWKFCQSGSPHRIQRNDLTFKKWKEQEEKKNRKRFEIDLYLLHSEWIIHGLMALVICCQQKTEMYQ